MTARGPASGTPRMVRKRKAATASTAAIIAVPRMYPPARRIASSPAVADPNAPPLAQVPQADVPALLAVEQEVERQEQAEHDDRRDVRDRADEGRGLGPDPGLDLRDDRIDRRRELGRERRSSTMSASSLATPAWTFWASSTSEGTRARRISTSATITTATAMRSAPADALARPQPRARSAPAAGRAWRPRSRRRGWTA